MENNEQKKVDFMEEAEIIKPAIEAVIFASPTPIGINQIIEILGGASRDIVKSAILMLQEEYNPKSKGFSLIETAGGYHFRTKSEYKDYIAKLTKTRPTRLSQSALETLAIIAYKQPIIRAEIEDIRGVDSGFVVKALLDKKLIRIIGKKDIVGKPLLYGTTKEFLDLFSLKDLSSLPTLKDIKELEGGGIDETQLSFF